ncbi:DUF6308 family protein [Streptomyces sp. NPDC052236]|uniref:DUF6308 family protein n=1 Tax=Streptomyces sp. NPDC052236 TaxID=3365686 RepID=UPI0037D34183
MPVHDQVVRCVLGRPKSFWLDLHAALRVDNWALHHELMPLRQAAYLPETVSALRVCDVACGALHNDAVTKTFKYDRAETETLLAMTAALLRNVPGTSA